MVIDSQMGAPKIDTILILGAGPAGLSAALQLLRAKIPVQIIAHSLSGTYQNANLIENLICFPIGITGLEFQKKMNLLIEKHKIPIISDEITSVKQISKGFELVGSKEVYHSKILIIATGTKPNRLDIPGELEAFKNGRLFYEIPYPIPKNSKICCIGSGDAAYDYALHLQKSNIKLDIIQRTQTHRCLELLFERALNEPNIKIKYPYSLREIRSNNRNISLIYQSKPEIENTYDYAFITVGRSPNIDFLSPHLTLAFKNKQSIPDLYYIGDVINDKYRQIAIAMGDGIRLGMMLSEKFRPKNNP